MSSLMPLNGRSTILCDFMGSSPLMALPALAAASCACCTAVAIPSGKGAAPAAAEHLGRICRV